MLSFLLDIWKNELSFSENIFFLKGFFSFLFFFILFHYFFGFFFFKFFKHYLMGYSFIFILILFNLIIINNKTNFQFYWINNFNILVFDVYKLRNFPLLLILIYLYYQIYLYQIFLTNKWYLRNCRKLFSIKFNSLIKMTAISASWLYQ